MADPITIDVMTIAVTAIGTEPILDEDGATLVDDEGATLVTDGDAVFFFRRPSTSMPIVVTYQPVDLTVERRRVYVQFGPFLRAPAKVYPGQTVAINGTFNDEDGIPFDPLTVELRIASPSWGISDYTYLQTEDIRRTSDGRYTFDLTVDEPGRWIVQWRTTAVDVVSIKESSINVQDTPHYQSPRRRYA